MKRLALPILLAILTIPSTAGAAPIQGYQDQATEVNANTYPAVGMDRHGASVMRIGISAARAGQGLQAVHDAAAAGKRVYLTLDGDATDPASEVAFFERWLPVYEQAAPIWAVSVQNEPELGGPGQYAPESPAQYRAIWDAVEPVIHRIDPSIIAVFGEGCPVSEPVIKSAWTTNRPKGVGAIAYHPYGFEGILDGMPEFAAWAASQGVPLWASEYTDWADPPADFQAALAASPNVRLVSFYEWAQPGPFVTGSFHPQAISTRPVPVTNATPSTIAITAGSVHALKSLWSPPRYRMPQLRHSTLRHARWLLRTAHLRLGRIARLRHPRRVVRQSVRAGARVAVGTRIRITLGNTETRKHEPTRKGVKT